MLYTPICPGYNSARSDLPPPKICGAAWQDRVMASLGDVSLILLIGGYAHRWHLGAQKSVTQTVKDWRDHAPRVFPLPHPSWRNTAWLKKNPWFMAELLPALRTAVKEALK